LDASPSKNHGDGVPPHKMSPVSARDPATPTTPTTPLPPGRRILITAGPTHEPIDAVRFIGNRSSGRLGIALARSAAARGWQTTLLLGPTCQTKHDHNVRTRRFTTVNDLQALLREEGPACDVVIMAAAVADFRPRIGPGDPAAGTKLRRAEGGNGLTLDLEPTPDLLAELAARRPPGQFIVGFALEPRDALLASAREKLLRKGVDLIVANPLETMEAPTIDAVVLGRDGSERSMPGKPGEPGEAGAGDERGGVPKEDFARWLLDLIETHLEQGRLED
jgi:phosphopantothenoylcysteine decarboxylase / phosphopantothenate---cysteine ligase